MIGLDGWLEAMRLPGGYGGAVVYPGADNLEYSGIGLDWRYEGIIIGYLNLWHATANPAWLEKACRAGDDLLAGQLPSGNFRNSAFEWNPNTGATPHEAAASLGLLRLALALRSLNDETWMQYYQAGRANLENYHIRYLWEERGRVFYDGPAAPAVSPDRLATLAEAFFFLARLSGEARWAEKYAFACLDAILAHQVNQGEWEGAIHNRSVLKAMDGRFYPHRIARCVPALLMGYAWTGEAALASAARRVGRFLGKVSQPDGSFFYAVYAHGGKNRYPAWVAPVGDILRAMGMLQALDIPFDLTPGLRWLLAGRMENGAIRTAVGFGRTRLPPRRQDERDQIACCGWADKAFRFLASLVEPTSFETFLLEKA